MKYLSLFLITNILAISVIRSSADDPSDGVRLIHTRATLAIKDKPSSSPDDSSVPAKITFEKDGKIIDEIEEENTITFKITVNRPSEIFKEGRVSQCTMFEKGNSENSLELFDKCKKSSYFHDWNWLQEEQLFESKLKVVKLPGSTSNEVEISCSAIVCGERCPPVECPSRRKRGLFFKKPLSLLLRAQKVG